MRQKRMQIKKKIEKIENHTKIKRGSNKITNKFTARATFDDYIVVEVVVVVVVVVDIVVVVGAGQDRHIIRDR